MRAFLALALVTRSAWADPSFAHLHSPRLACLGTVQTLEDCVQLAAGYFMDEPTYNRLDAEMKRLQDAETRLRAENSSLKESAQPGWMVLASALAVGVVLGVYVDRKL